MSVNTKKDLRTGRPIWLSLPYPKIPVSPLTSDKRVDVVIIGAGITGAMAAQELAAVGFKVVLLDRRGPMKGSTAATTALLQYEIDTPLTTLQKKIGVENAMRAWRRSKLGLDSLAAKIQSLDIGCQMKRASSLYLAGTLLNSEQLREEEKQFRNEIGLLTDFCSRSDLYERYGIRRNGALVSYDNLTVNPLKMTAGFLFHAIENGAEILAPVDVEKVTPTSQGVEVHTDTGHTVEARFVIYATGYEIPKVVRTRRHSVHSTYAIATKKQKNISWLKQTLVWEASNPYLYVRATADGRIICGGEDGAFQSEEKRDALLAKKTACLEHKLKELLPDVDAHADYAWCGSFGASTTGLPSMGEIPEMKHCYAILAFGGNGITFSRIAAELLTSQLTGRRDPDADLYTF